MPGDKSTFKEHSSFKESDIVPACMVLVINIAALLAGGLLERVALVPHLVATHHNGLYSWQVNCPKIFDKSRRPAFKLVTGPIIVSFSEKNEHIQVRLKVC